MEEKWFSIFIELYSAIKEKKIGLVLLLLFVIPGYICLLLLGVFIIILVFIFKAPFEYPKYISSFFYKNFKKKYTVGITDYLEFSFYNYAIKNNLDIEFINDIDEKIIYMKKNNIIYVFDHFTKFWFVDGKWQTYISDDDYADEKEISEYIGKCYKDYKLPMKVVVNERELEKDSIDEAYKCEYLYVYKDLSDLKKL